MGEFVQVNKGSPHEKSHPLGYIVAPDGCWNWVGARNGSGYGVWQTPGKGKMAHRRMYELHRGSIPEGLQIDHLCRNRGCVNPKHLEVVTNRENVLRGEGHTARNARKTSCQHGHPFTPENTRITSRGYRDCRACDLERWNGRKHLRKSRATEAR